MATDLSKQLAEQTFLRARAEKERDDLRRWNEALSRLIGHHAMEVNNCMTNVMGCGELLQRTAKLEGDAEIYLQELLVAGRRVCHFMSELCGESRRIRSTDQVKIEPVCMTEPDSIDEPTVVFFSAGH